jgi:hypothetical protein
LQYNEGIPSATAVAHHGLQALEAAAAAVPVSPNPIAQQYAQSASMHVTDGQYVPAPLPPMGNGAPGTPATPASQKVTRLRRACDMCSQRKVKVCCVTLDHVSHSLALNQGLAQSHKLMQSYVTVRCQWTTMQALSRSKCPLYFPAGDETTRAPQQARGGSKGGQETATG